MGLDRIVAVNSGTISKDRAAPRGSVVETERACRMIRYKCANCGARMESPSCLAGQEDICPGCGALNTVPVPSDVPSFVTRILALRHAGVEEDDGGANIHQCTVGESLVLHHDPNPYDENAVKVLRANGQEVGYLVKDVAVQLAPRLAQGDKIAASVVNISEPTDTTLSGLTVQINR